MMRCSARENRAFISIRRKKETMREEMDEFENYCLAYGVQGKRWTSEDPWMYRRYRSLDDTNGMMQIVNVKWKRK